MEFLFLKGKETDIIVKKQASEWTVALKNKED